MRAGSSLRASGSREAFGESWAASREKVWIKPIHALPSGESLGSVWGSSVIYDTYEVKE